MKASNSNSRIITDETIRESISHGNEQYPFKYYLEDIWQFDFHCIDWHWHPEVEFVYIKSGHTTATVGNRKYVLTPGNGIFINSQIIHRFESEEHTIIPNIVFSPLLLASKDSLIYQKYVHPILTASTDCLVFSPEIPWQKEIMDILGSVFSLQETQQSNELVTVQLLLNLWNILFENIKTSQKEQQNKNNAQDQARLQIMLQYIHENYQKEITLEQLSKVISLSKSSILNLFNNYVHMTPIDYVIHYRLKKAAHLLDTTENTVTSIAQSVGFDNIGYFCRKFKKMFQLTPGQYRKAKH